MKKTSLFSKRSEAFSSLIQEVGESARIEVSVYLLLYYFYLANWLLLKDLSLNSQYAEQIFDHTAGNNISSDDDVMDDILQTYLNMSGMDFSIILEGGIIHWQCATRQTGVNPKNAETKFILVPTQEIDTIFFGSQGCCVNLLKKVNIDKSLDMALSIKNESADKILIKDIICDILIQYFNLSSKISNNTLLPEKEKILNEYYEFFLKKNESSTQKFSIELEEALFNS